MLARAASPNSAATSHHRRRGTASCVLRWCTRMSMMIFGIHSRAMGSKAATMRPAIPKLTTPGPDCHTILSTGGTFRRAERRSCQLLQKFSFCDIWPSPGPVAVPDADSEDNNNDTHQRCLKPAWGLTEATLAGDPAIILSSRYG